MATTASLGSSLRITPEELREIIADYKGLNKENIGLEFVIDYLVQDPKTPRVKEIVITTYSEEVQIRP